MTKKGFTTKQILRAGCLKIHWLALSNLMENALLLSVKWIQLLDQLHSEFHLHILLFTVASINSCSVTHSYFRVFHTFSKVSVPISYIACSVLSLRWEKYYMGKKNTLSFTWLQEGNVREWISMTLLAMLQRLSLLSLTLWKLDFKLWRTSTFQCGEAPSGWK